MDVLMGNGETVRFIGDPHLGKSFEVGVPLDRRGERERRQMEKFKDSLDAKTSYVVVVGDVFDHPYVGFSTVLETYKALVNAAASNRDVTYVVMAGNHDMPRNLEAVGAFTLLQAMCHLRADNLHVISHPAQIGPIACFPWEWHRRADEQRILAPLDDDVHLVVGHWDLQLYEGNDTHLAPVKYLRETYGDVPLWSGHYHVAGEYVIDGVSVTCTGSMEPYSHGEDPEGHIYVTMTVPELEKAAEHGELRNKCVRVLLEEGQEMPTGIDCLALTPKRVVDGEQASAVAQLSDFNWMEIVERKLKDLPVPVKDFINDRLHT